MRLLLGTWLRGYEVVLGLGLSACAAAPSTAAPVASAPPVATAGGSTNTAVISRPATNGAKLLLGWGSALLADGRLVLPRALVVDHADALPQRGFLWGRENGALRLLRDGATSPQVPSFFQTWAIAQLSPSGACLLTESGEIWCHGFSRSLRFEAPVEDSAGLHWYRLMPRTQKRALSVDGDSTVGCAVLDDGQADCWLGERPFASGCAKCWSREPPSECIAFQ